MQHEMRRKKQQLSDSEAVRIMEEGSFGVLAVAGTDGAPYAVPLNYMYAESGLTDSWDGPAIYFHSALTGHKIELLEQNSRASFCVVAEHEVVPDMFATAYQSAIAFGTVHYAEGEAFHDALYALGDKYNPGAVQAIEHEIESNGPRCAVLELRIEALTAKQASAAVMRSVAPSSKA